MNFNKITGIIVLVGAGLTGCDEPQNNNPKINSADDAYKQYNVSPERVNRILGKGCLTIGSTNMMPSTPENFEKFLKTCSPEVQKLARTVSEPVKNILSMIKSPNKNPSINDEKPYDGEINIAMGAIRKIEAILTIYHGLSVYERKVAEKFTSVRELFGSNPPNDKFLNQALTDLKSFDSFLKLANTNESRNLFFTRQFFKSGDISLLNEAKKEQKKYSEYQDILDTIPPELKKVSENSYIGVNAMRGNIEISEAIEELKKIKYLWELISKNPKLKEKLGKTGYTYDRGTKEKIGTVHIPSWEEFLSGKATNGKEPYALDYMIQVTK